MKKEETVKLISAEGFEFVIDKKAAMVSHTIRNMLTSPGGFAETQLGEVTFPEISTPILEKICQYFYWSLQYTRTALHGCQPPIFLLPTAHGCIYAVDPIEDSCGPKNRACL
ncbi:elongin-C isoform X1 [Elaeis guineensis]|uniref:elongin-C isoform X1 n=1 Tax=Elaeis guineensis var. tenera TaxID=51953 RepID=UPI003C6D069D